jgi:hypothetical protein
MMEMAVGGASFACVPVVTIAVLVVLSCSVTAGDLPAGRTVYGFGTTDQFAALSVQSRSADPDAFLASFSEGEFSLDYIRQGSQSIVPDDLHELTEGIYVPGALNWSMGFSVLEVFEFRNSGSESFGPEDYVISSEDISNKKYTLSQPVTENTPGWGVRTTHTAISEDGLVTLVFVVNSDYAFFTLGEDIDPTEIHMSLRVSRYNLSDDGNAIGVAISVNSQSSAGMLYQESNEGTHLNITTDQPFSGGSVSWLNWVCIDGATVGLGAAASWSDGCLTLSYPRANTLIQDFVFKVRSNMTYYADSDDLSPDPVLYVSGLGAASILVIVSIGFAKRGRRLRNH